MKSSIRKELEVYINDCLEDGLKSHNEMFSESYYTNEYTAKLWLNHHDLDVLDAINECRELELQYFGEIATEHFSSYEVLVNKLVYFYGLQLCAEADIFTGLCQ